MYMSFAFVFPGQGSQSIGMMAALAALPEIQQTFQEASDILGIDFWQMATKGPHDLLNMTLNTQPIMLVAGVATWRAWLGMGGNQPDWLAGHSLGEYSALVAAGVLSFADALSLVRLRAQVMQEAVPEGQGAMAAILGLDNETIIMACESVALDQVLQAVNFNSPGQVVIAGHKEAVERGIAACQEAGAKRAVLLPVSVPAHSDLMKPAAQALRTKLDNITVKPPLIPVLHNVDVAQHTTIESIKEALVRQLYSPVRWVEIINMMATQGVNLIGECGPGKVLAGLVKRINNEITGLALTDVATMEKMKSQINT
jgi:[acyl-carrier-protein] S-malonyltransferase